jgi:transcriptional regulator with XRE-family HTH domain
MTKASEIAESAAIEEAFGQVIQEIRRQRGLSQEQLGFESGLHRTYVSLLERGKRSPTLPTLLQLAAAKHIPFRNSPPC